MLMKEYLRQRKGIIQKSTSRRKNEIKENVITSHGSFFHFHDESKRWKWELQQQKEEPNNFQKTEKGLMRSNLSFLYASLPKYVYHKECF